MVGIDAAYATSEEVDKKISKLREIVEIKHEKTAVFRILPTRLDHGFA
jgi:hypothetical protein